MKNIRVSFIMEVDDDTDINEIQISDDSVVDGFSVIRQGKDMLDNFKLKKTSSFRLEDITNKIGEILCIGDSVEVYRDQTGFQRTLNKTCKVENLAVVKRVNSTFKSNDVDCLPWDMPGELIVITLDDQTWCWGWQARPVKNKL